MYFKPQATAQPPAPCGRDKGPRRDQQAPRYHKHQGMRNMRGADVDIYSNKALWRPFRKCLRRLCCLYTATWR
eukprot:scaffold184524_cov34-Tisochrysis_lutea.AAC.3